MALQPPLLYSIKNDILFFVPAPYPDEGQFPDDLDHFFAEPVKKQAESW